MDDLMRLLTLVLTVVTVATACGLGLQRARVADLRDQLTDSRAENADNKRRLDESEAKSAQLATDLDALGRVVTGEAHWVAIGQQLDHHHAEAMRHWTNDENILQHIADLLARREGRT